MKKKLLISFAVIVILTVLLKLAENYVDNRWSNGDGFVHPIRFFIFFLIGIYFIFVAALIKKKFITNILLLFGTIVILISIIEILFYVAVIHNMPKALNTYSMKSNQTENRFSQEDKNMGYIGIPNTKAYETFFYDGKEKIVAEYNFDEFGRRFTPKFSKSEENKKYAVFFGCSFTLGYLVNDDQTSAGNFSKEDTNYHVYNYAMDSYGTNQLLALMQSERLPKEVKEKQGVFVYFYLDRHIRRAVGDQYLIEARMFTNNSPYFESSGDTLIRNKGFETGRYWTTQLYKILNYSYILRYFNIKFPILFPGKQADFTAQLIDQSYKNYKKNFGKNDFYIVIYPGQNNEILKHIKEKGIKVLDYSKLFDINSPVYSIPGDFHPTPFAYQTVAKQLAKDINNSKK
jgi:energy-coupling factor transporter transmembrane protein EcfT